MTARRALAALALALAACRATPEPPPQRFAAGHEIVACGRRLPIDAPVVLWTEEPFYDAYREGPRFAAQGEPGEPGKRYRPGRDVQDPRVRALVEYHGWSPELLREAVDLFVLHYDACGTSRECFRVLQDERQLSVHFLLDVDGTLYQTLDLVEQAWHARAANPRSIGIEIAHVGAYAPGEREPFERWYEWTEEGTRLVLPPGREEGVRTRAFRGRPAREGFVTGSVHGQLYAQPDFTPEQYASLAALTATLVRAFPRIDLAVPRDAQGAVRTGALSDEEEAAFHGILGHYHLQADKRDPGPAFDWERLLSEARTRLAEP